MKEEKNIEIAIATLLVILWVYTAGSKLIDFNTFRGEIYNQVFSKSFATILLYVIPAAEFIAALLLLQHKTRMEGFSLSFILMLFFTGYVGLVLMGYYNKVPCSCAGLIKSMGWKAHLIFNLLLMAIAITGIIITYKNRRAVTTMKIE